MTSFQERLKALRKHFGLSQGQLADRIGVKRNTVSKYESAILNPAGAVVELICREFGVSKDWLLEGKGEMLAPTENRLIDEMTAKYQLDDLDRAILGLYLRLDSDGRRELRRAAVEVAEAVRDTPGLLDLLRRDAAPPEPKNVHEWTREEMHAEVDRQFDEEEKGTDEPSTGSPPESGSDCA